MVHEETSTGNKPKPRGRPFPKGNKKGKLNEQALASPRHQSGDGGGYIDIPEDLMDALESHLRTEMGEVLQGSLKSSFKDSKIVKPSDLTIIEEIEFKNGANTLTIRFSKKSNRMYRIQIFLNDQTEIRPVTYTGASTGYSFWNLLKGALKK